MDQWRSTKGGEAVQDVQGEKATGGDQTMYGGNNDVERGGK